MSRKPKEEVAVFDAMETHSYLKQQLSPIKKKALAPRRRVDFSELVRGSRAAFSEQVPYSTGFESLDEQLGGGLYPGVVSVAGEAGSGKTTLIKQFVEHVVPGLAFPADFDFVMLSRNSADFGSFDAENLFAENGMGRFLAERKNIATQDGSVFIFSTTIRSQLYGNEGSIVERVESSAYRTCDTMLHINRVVEGDDIYFTVAANLKNRYGQYEFPLTFIMENGRLVLA